MLSSTQRASGAPNRGISSPSFHGSGSSRTGHLQGWEAGGERPQSLQRRAGMLRPLSDKRTRFSHTSVSLGAPGVLRTPASPPHTCRHFAHRGLCNSLQAVPGHRAPFCAVEEIVLPRTTFSCGVDISSGRSRNLAHRRERSRNLAHRRDRIPVRDPEEGVRRLAFGVVLYGGRSAAGSSPDRPSGVQQRSPEETPKFSWHPRSPQLEEDKGIHYLMGRIRLLAHSGLTMIGVMATCIMRGVQPLQYRGHPMWDFNRENDATRHGRKGPGSAADLVKILSGLYKGEKEDFLRTNPLNGFSMNNPRSWVSGRLYI